MMIDSTERTVFAREARRLSKKIFACVFTCSIALPLAADEGALCTTYRQGQVVVEEIAAFVSQEDLEDGIPEGFIELKYDSSYRVLRSGGLAGVSDVSSNHNFIFEFSLDARSGQSDHQVPLASSSVGSGTNFKLKIKNTWLDLEDYLIADLSIPGDREEILQSYKKLGSLEHLNEISFREYTNDALSSDYVRKRHQEHEFYVGKQDRDFTAYMICQEPSSAIVPFCDYRTMVGPFLATANFERDQLPNLNMIVTRLDDFVTCLTED